MSRNDTHAAKFAGDKTVQQPCLFRKSLGGLQRCGVTNAKSLEDAQAELSAEFRRFLTMELDCVDAALRDGLEDFLFSWIAELPPSAYSL